MIEYLSAGTLLGLASGFAPGPLLVLVLSETLRHDIRAGIKVAIAPLILNRLAHFKTILGGVSILGGLFIFYLGYDSIKTKGVEFSLPPVSRNSFKRGVTTNALNPHPYIFYMTVGAPIIFKAINHNFLSAFSFIGSFLLFLVGSKVILALVVERSRAFLKGPVYIGLMRILGALLFFFSIMLFRDGLRLFGLI
jgi:threonine/homoserine/homoserine lactone efflux protein